MEIHPPDTLYGLYQGTAPAGARDGTTAMHDAGSDHDLSRADSRRHGGRRDELDIVRCIGETVIHEFGHYFGLSEEEIEEIEARYWRDDEERMMVRAKRRLAQHFLESSWGRHGWFSVVAPGAGGRLPRDRPRTRRADVTPGPVRAHVSSPWSWTASWRRTSRPERHPT